MCAGAIPSYTISKAYDSGKAAGFSSSPTAQLSSSSHSLPAIRSPSAPKSVQRQLDQPARSAGNPTANATAAGSAGASRAGISQQQAPQGNMCDSPHHLTTIVVSSMPPGASCSCASYVCRQKRKTGQHRSTSCRSSLGCTCVTYPGSLYIIVYMPMCTASNQALRILSISVCSVLLQLPPDVVTGQDAIRYFGSGAGKPSDIIYCNLAVPCSPCFGSSTQQGSASNEGSNSAGSRTGGVDSSSCGNDAVYNPYELRAVRQQDADKQQHFIVSYNGVIHMR